MMRHIEILNRSNRILRGYLHDVQSARTIVVMFHGYTGNKTEHHGHFRTLSRRLETEHIASLRMDYACNGESDGEFNDFLFDEALDDAQRMIDFALSLNFDEVIVLGYSMGGLVASLVCNTRPITKMILWSPSATLGEKLSISFEAAPKLANGNLYSGGFEISRNLIQSMQGYNPLEEAKRFLAPVVIIHGTLDQAVPYAQGVAYAATYPKAQLVTIEEANHGYDTYHHKQILMQKTIEFLK